MEDDAQFVESLKCKRGCERRGVRVRARVSLMAAQGSAPVLIGLVDDFLGLGPSQDPFEPLSCDRWTKRVEKRKRCPDRTANKGETDTVRGLCWEEDSASAGRLARKMNVEERRAPMASDLEFHSFKPQVSLLVYSACIVSNYQFTAKQTLNVSVTTAKSYTVVSVV